MSPGSKKLGASVVLPPLDAGKSVVGSPRPPQLPASASGMNGASPNGRNVRDPVSSPPQQQSARSANGAAASTDLAASQSMKKSVRIFGKTVSVDDGKNSAQQQQPPSTPSAESLLPQIRTLVKDKKEYRKSIEVLDSAIGSTTYADLPMFDDAHPNPPQYSNKVLLELLALRIECWMNLLQFGRVLEDVTSAMKVDLTSALLQRQFVIPKLHALHDLGEIQVGLQVANALEVAVQRNGPLLEEVTEWKRKFVLLSRKKNEMITGDDGTAAAAAGGRTIVIGSRRIAAGAPNCRHGCPDREPASYFQMEIVMSQQHIGDGCIAMHRLYTEYDGAKLQAAGAWKFYARQELRKAIDAAAVENWKVCREATKMYLIATEFDSKARGPQFVESMDTLGRMPNPLSWDITHNFFVAYDRAMSTTDHLVDLLCDLSKSHCSCMSEIAELRSRRVKTVKIATAAAGDVAAATAAASSTRAAGGPQQQGSSSASSGAASASVNLEGKTAASVNSIAVNTAHRKEKDAVRIAQQAKEDGSVLYLARKFQSALKHYDDAIAVLEEAQAICGGHASPAAAQLSMDLFFNRTSALFELEQYDSVVRACDMALENAARKTATRTVASNNASNSGSGDATVAGGGDRIFVSKILARRAEALHKLGALDEALMNYTESCDAVESPKHRAKMLEIAVEIQKRKFNTSVRAQDENRKIQQAAGATAIPVDVSLLHLAGEANAAILAGTLSSVNNINNTGVIHTSAPPGFASAVLIEPNRATTAASSGQITMTMFPTQIATASPYFSDAIPMPLMNFAGFPFAVVPSAPRHMHQQRQRHEEKHENFFAALATKALSVDTVADAVHNRRESDIWSYCGSVIVLRKDFKPVACGQVLRLFQLLLDLWTVRAPEHIQQAASLDQQQHQTSVNPAAASSSGSVVGMSAAAAASASAVTTINDAVKHAKLRRLEFFSDPKVARAKLLEALNMKKPAATSSSATGKNDLDHSGDADDGSDDDNFDVLPGNHVINTFSSRQKLNVHGKERDRQQALMLKEQADLLYRSRRHRTALLRYDESLALEPANPVVWYNRAACLLELHQPQLALESCDQAMEHAHQNSSWSLKQSSTAGGGGAGGNVAAMLIEKIVARRNHVLRSMGKLPASAQEGAAIEASTPIASEQQQDLEEGEKIGADQSIFMAPQ